MSYLLRKNPFAILDTEDNTINVTLFSESCPTLAEAQKPKSNKCTKDTIIIINDNNDNDGKWSQSKKINNTKKTKKTRDVVIEIIPAIHPTRNVTIEIIPETIPTQDFVIDIPPTQEEDDNLTQEENDLFDKMQEKLIKYAHMINPEINVSKVQFTRYYTIAVIMVCQIISHLNDIKQKNSVFSRTVIRGLMSVGPNNVDLIQLIYNYLDICDEYLTDDFSETTFNGYYGTNKRKNFDINYHLTNSEANLTIGECANRFVTLLKVLRTSVAWSIFHATGSYDVPTEPININDWAYALKTDAKNGKNGKKYSSERFVDFILNMSIIHEEFEKMNKELSCINDIFVLAKHNVSSFLERKRLVREYRDKQKEISLKRRYRSHTENNKSFQSVQNASSVPTTTHIAPIVEAPKIRIPISAPITWSTNRVSNMFSSDKKPNMT
jgi:hypothetical protein